MLSNETPLVIDGVWGVNTEDAYGKASYGVKMAIAKVMSIFNVPNVQFLRDVAGYTELQDALARQRLTKGVPSTSIIQQAIDNANEPQALWRLSAESERRLTETVMTEEHGPRQVHPDLVKVIRRAAALSVVPFVVYEGVRTKAKQQEYMKVRVNGKRVTWTMNSPHRTGHAVDIVPLRNGRPVWDWSLINQLRPYIERAAKECGVKLTWGGSWHDKPDGPHWELDRKVYQWT